MPGYHSTAVLARSGGILSGASLQPEEKEMSEASLVERITKLQQELGSKKSFPTSCQALTALCEELGDEPPKTVVEALVVAAKRTFTVLQTRFSNPKFWQAGLDFFLAIEFHVPTCKEASSWRDAAMEEVDEEARQRAQAQRHRRKLAEDRQFNQGAFSDANTRLTMSELAASQGLILIDADEARRPAMSRDARHDLRLITVHTEDICCVCQESLPVGSKAKSMPCGHLFHDDCLESWVSKNNSCPMCRYDELPSEKVHFDDVERRLMQEGTERKGLYA
eukprot:gnl/TRDRNA2_/TRDRNA2_200288_c0_seq1.p1 gnl/TRDRNA2_/TRDRNA2_200288_c0~~gnl/TRDRNA2_/TRDRNA2_200288_c0_seq1.p1  ORF type:complete len:296 (-),score=57.41 gnl/TRDRNA2_/TRDRNA2_200288_c0_seq1:68-904(-)